MKTASPRLAVLDYGIGNLRSAQKALQRLGADAHLTDDPGRVAEADGVVLPGVGAFGPCMDALRARRLETVVGDVVARGTPFLGICVGAQMLFEGSVEAPATPGLGVLAGRVEALPPGVKHPQMQWNRLDVRRADDPVLGGLGPDPWVYFVHSFAPVTTDGVLATCDYGGEVVAAVGSGSTWALQFHPEKSGATGLAILGAFVALTAPVGA